ncbi:hypothetical protein WDV91_05520 [Curtobacterium flaccumfaciens pv. flaccumfaciens]
MTASPFWNVQPSRSVIVHVVASSLSTLFAATSCRSPSASVWVSGAKTLITWSKATVCRPGVRWSGSPVA